MNLNGLHKVYFFGIGGIGMSAIARYFNQMGLDVAGYDRTSSPLISELEKEGIEVNFNASPEAVPSRFIDSPLDRVLFIYTPAIPARHEGLGFCKSRGFNVIKRSQALEAIVAEKDTYAVAGTHGKTTTSSMVAHLLNQGNHNATAFLGGIATNFKSNLVVAKDSTRTIVEADEYDRSFLRLRPSVAAITSVDADHLDIYGNAESLRSSFEQFAQLVPKDGLLLLCEGIEMNVEAPVWSYAVESETADLTTKNLRVEDGAYCFEVWLKGEKLGEIVMHYPGRHNAENALAAIGMALHAGVDWNEIAEGLKTFLGVKRRFEYQIRRENRVYIDDYAHHPTEITACVNSAKELYPEKRITGVFQPHLYSRTRDFADEFAESLSELNDLLLMDIYPAREEPIEGVDSQMLLNKVRLVNKKLVDRENLVEEVLRLSPEILLTMGAGDIDRMIEPLKNALDEKDE
ncbi:UDP-N-acetylmuramate--L-alanine ligase [Cryomorphaceae bacterium 1068]|nr:UDP-N-acetylmuramate--L-alanine ligase [Cryomorphaceae bacterium 1068]